MVCPKELELIKRFCSYTNQLEIVNTTLFFLQVFILVFKYKIEKRNVNCVKVTATRTKSKTITVGHQWAFSNAKKYSTRKWTSAGPQAKCVLVQ